MRWRTTSRSSSPLARFGTRLNGIPPSAAAPPDSYQKMWHSSPMMISSPRPQWASSAARLPIVPLATKTAASLPSIRAASCSSRVTVGSSPYWSSPTSAFAIAWRIASVGLVTVSLRRSITLPSPRSSIEHHLDGVQDRPIVAQSLAVPAGRSRSCG